MDPSGTYVCIDDALSKVFREKFFGKAASDAYVKDAALLIASDKRILSMVETASKLFVAECRRSAEGQL